jgi:hypothetical protein
MPKALEAQLRKEVEKRDWPEKRKNAWVFGIMRKTGWKPPKERKTS